MGVSERSDWSEGWDQENQVVTANTGELSWNYGDRHISVSATKTQGVVGFAGGHAFDLPDVDIEVTTPFVSLLVTALDNRSISESGKVLVTAVARERWTGSEIEGVGDDANLNALGGPPLMMEPVQASLTFGAAFDSAEALDVHGRRTERALTPNDDGAYVIDGRYATMYYLFEREVPDDPEDMQGMGGMAGADGVGGTLGEGGAGRAVPPARPPRVMLTGRPETAIPVAAIASAGVTCHSMGVGVRGLGSVATPRERQSAALCMGYTVAMGNDRIETRPRRFMSMGIINVLVCALWGCSQTSGTALPDLGTTADMERAPPDSTPLNMDDAEIMDTSMSGARILSAYHAGALPIVNVLCETPAAGEDGMPVVFSVQLDIESVRADVFAIETSEGETVTPLCASLAPAVEPLELRTVLLMGPFGTEGSTPRSVEVVGPLLALNGVSLEGLKMENIAPQAGHMVLRAVLTGYGGSDGSVQTPLCRSFKPLGG